MTTGCGCPQRQASAGSQVTLVEGGTDAAFLPIRPGRAHASAGRSPGTPGGGKLDGLRRLYRLRRPLSAPLGRDRLRDPAEPVVLGLGRTGSPRATVPD